jgi:RNA 2',3'-cyclic 3'-phosphodiesterase
MPMMAHPSPTNLRVFLGVELSQDIFQKVAQLQHQLQGILPRINWIHPESIHLTLKFLGYIGEEMVETLLITIEPLLKSQSSMSVQIQGVGVFPQIRRPRILWIGCTGDVSSLVNLVSQIESSLELLGWSPESKPFHPHLTLARIKHDNSKVGRALIHSGILEQPHNLGTLHIRRIALIRSDLGVSGAKYTPLWTVSLNEIISDSSTFR